MYEEQNKRARLEAGWRVILVIWGVMLASLGIYIVICINIEKSIQINTDPSFPLKTIRYALFGVSCITLFVVYCLRKFLMKPNISIANSRQMSSNQHPAVGKYTVAILMTSGLLESIGIYGVVLFLWAKDTSSLYQLVIISAAAMLFFRPRKEELFNLAAHMNAQR
jgi:hypothetical protein